MSVVQHRSCDYCGLPLPRPLWGGGQRDDPSVPAYCCFGCRFAASVTGETGDDGAARWTLTRLGLAIFLSMNVMVCTFVLWSYDVYDGASGTAMSTALAELLRSLSLLLALPVLLLLGGPIVSSAIADLRRGVMSTDLLVMAGVAAAFVYSVASLLRGSGTTYFEVGCMVLVFITLGRWIEATGKLKASNALDELQRLLPEQVTKLTAAGPEQIPIADVRVGDVLLVRPHERFPTDGILQGETSVDQQIVTGESWPMTMQTGDAVAGGALNLETLVQLRVTALPAEGTLGRLVDAVRTAREAKGRYQRLADQVAGWFLVVVTVIAAGALVWHGRTSGWGPGLMASLSVLLIACPCALGLATPLAVWTALGRAARRGVVFRSGETLERLSEVRSLRFDKTGTLTTGQPRLLRVHSDGLTDPDLIKRFAGPLASVSHHAFCTAILAEVTADDSMTLRTQGWAEVEAHELPGLGVVGRLDQSRASAGGGGEDGGGDAIRVVLGSERLMTQEGLALPDRLRALLDQDQTAGHPVAAIGWEGRVRGLFVFAESLRPHAAEVVSSCRELGLDVAVLTGDHASRGRQVADELGVRVEAGLRPEQKIQCVRAAGQFAPVAMVGDGINDAPALAAADVGIAMGCGTDLARDTAEVCLVGDDLRQLPWIIALSRRTVRTIRQNLAWAFGYNAVGVLIAASGRLHPALAAALMLVSSLIVITNSLRLNRSDNADEMSGSDLHSQGVVQLPEMLSRSVAEVRG